MKTIESINRQIMACVNRRNERVMKHQAAIRQINRDTDATLIRLHRERVKLGYEGPTIVAKPDTNRPKVKPKQTRPVMSRSQMEAAERQAAAALARFRK